MSIYLPFESPRLDDPNAAMVVQENLRTFTELFQKGATQGDSLSWNAATGRYEASQAGVVSYGTSFPGSPVDGQQAVIVDSVTSPTYQWHFRYNAGSSNSDKWEFIGGPPIFAEVTTSEILNSATYVALTTAGPSIVIPRAGVYEVSLGCLPSSYNTISVFMSYDIGGTGAVDADACFILNNDTVTSMAASVSRSRIKTIAAGSTTLTSKYRQSAGGTNLAVSSRWIKAIPVRCS